MEKIKYEAPKIRDITVLELEAEILGASVAIDEDVIEEEE